MLTVYSKNSCSQCVMLKNLLTMKKIPHSTKMLDVDYTMDDLVAKFASPSDMPRTFPVIFKDDVCLGGFNEAKLLVAKGEL